MSVSSTSPASVSVSPVSWPSPLVSGSLSTLSPSLSMVPSVPSPVVSPVLSSVLSAVSSLSSLSSASPLSAVSSLSSLSSASPLSVVSESPESSSEVSSAKSPKVACVWSLPEPPLADSEPELDADSEFESSPDCESLRLEVSAVLSALDSTVVVSVLSVSVSLSVSSDSAPFGAVSAFLLVLSVLLVLSALSVLDGPLSLLAPVVSWLLFCSCGSPVDCWFPVSD